MHLHHNLKLLRTYRGYNADVVANAIGVKRSTLSGWENAQSEPNCTHLLALSSYYRMSIDLLLGKNLMEMRRSDIEELQRAY